MRQVTLGKSGLKVSAVGIGGIPIQRVPVTEAVAAIRAALDLGVTFIDTAAGRREMTLEERLADERIVFLWGEITPNTAGGLIMRLLELQDKQPDRQINLYINSPGGQVDDTLAIYDTMQFLTCQVATYCVGLAASGAAVILASGTKGKRYALPHSKIMIHQPWGGVTGQASDIAIQAEEILKAKRLLNDLLARHTGRDLSLIEAETERDRYLTPTEAKEYGIVDEILEKSVGKP